MTSLDRIGTTRVISLALYFTHNILNNKLKLTYYEITIMQYYHNILRIVNIIVRCVNIKILFT